MTKAHPNTTKTYPIMIESNNILPKAHNMIKHTKQHDNNTSHNYKSTPRNNKRTSLYEVHHIMKQSTQNHIKSKQHTACAGVHLWRIQPKKTSSFIVPIFFSSAIGVYIDLVVFFYLSLNWMQMIHFIKMVTTMCLRVT